MGIVFMSEQQGPEEDIYELITDYHNWDSLTEQEQEQLLTEFAKRYWGDDVR